MWAFNSIEKVLNYLKKQGIEFEFSGNKKNSINIAQIDSRLVKLGDVFFCLEGEHTHGHHFVTDAVANGANLLVVEAYQYDQSNKVIGNQLKVGNSLSLLQQLARRQREAFTGTVVAITGSCGKTTTKEMVGAILKNSRPTLISQASFNNHIGVPLTLCQLTNEQAAVLELGTNSPGEIAFLTEIAKPTIAVITNADKAHLDGIGTLEDVIEEKSNILNELHNGTVAVLNKDHPAFSKWSKKAKTNQAKVISFGTYIEAQITLESRTPRETSQSLTLRTPEQSLELQLKLPGSHNAINAACAFAVAQAIGISMDVVRNSLEDKFSLSHRSTPVLVDNHRILFDDAYNSNPLSMQRAIDMLSEVKNRRVLVFGDMLELGDESHGLHREMGQYANKKQIDVLLCFGEHAPKALDLFRGHGLAFETYEALEKEVIRQFVSYTAVLVKGSRGMRLERIVNRLLDLNNHTELSTQ